MNKRTNKQTNSRRLEVYLYKLVETRIKQSWCENAATADAVLATASINAHHPSLCYKGSFALGLCVKFKVFVIVSINANHPPLCYKRISNQTKF